METKIFLTDLAAYNEGHLVGKWIDLPISNYDWSFALNEVLTEGEHISGSEDHEEWFITDYEAEFDIDEYSDIDTLNEMATAFNALDESDMIKVKYLIEYHGYNTMDAIDKIEDVEIYEDMNLEQLAEQFVDEGLFGSIPETIAYYIDYDAIARDLGYDYDTYENNIMRVA